MALSESSPPPSPRRQLADRCRAAKPVATQEVHWQAVGTTTAEQCATYWNIGTTTWTSASTQDLIWHDWTAANSTTITGNYINCITHAQNNVWQVWANQFLDDGDDWEDAHVDGARMRPPTRQRVVHHQQNHQEIADEVQRAREERSRRRLEEAARLEGAQSRALELLEGLLTAEERAYRAEHGEILVRGSAGGLYVIEQHGVHGNVRNIDEHGCTLRRGCAAPEMYDRVEGERETLALPEADGWIGQYLALKTQEQVYVRTANWSSHGVCRLPADPTDPVRQLGLVA